MNRLENKVAVITGASSGIGNSIARLFAAEGAKVVMPAARKSSMILPQKLRPTAV